MNPEHLFREVGRELLRAYERAAALPHHGERALERESALCEAFNQRLPSRFRAARGFVLFQGDVDDKQIDCVVYDTLNFGSRASLAGNVVALSKSVGVLIFETVNLRPDKFQETIRDIERLKRRFEEDRSHDPFSKCVHTQPLAFIVAHHAQGWDVLQAYQDEFRRLDEDGKRWRHLVDGILLLDPGDFLHPVARFSDQQLSRVVLNNVFLETLPADTEIGLLNECDPASAADAFLETVRYYLLRFKSPLAPNEETAVALPILPRAGEHVFKRCFVVRRVARQ